MALLSGGMGIEPADSENFRRVSTFGLFPKTENEGQHSESEGVECWGEA